jgi:hypothetical protein
VDMQGGSFISKMGLQGKDDNTRYSHSFLESGRVSDSSKPELEGGVTQENWGSDELCCQVQNSCQFSGEV